MILIAAMVAALQRWLATKSNQPCYAAFYEKENIFWKTLLSENMHDLTGFQRDLLYVIADLGDPKGFAIKDKLEGYYGTEINHGRLYPNLDKLVDKGLVEKGQIDDQTNSYSLTGRGEREIESRRTWEDDRIAVQLSVTSSGFAGLSPRSTEDSGLL